MVKIYLPSRKKHNLEEEINISKGDLVLWTMNQVPYKKNGKLLRAIIGVFESFDESSQKLFLRNPLILKKSEKFGQMDLPIINKKIEKIGSYGLVYKQEELYLENEINLFLKSNDGFEIYSELIKKFKRPYI